MRRSIRILSGTFVYSLAIVEAAGIAKKNNKNCSTFAVVIVTIGAMVIKETSLAEWLQLMISSNWFANMLNYSCLILWSQVQNVNFLIKNI